MIVWHECSHTVAAWLVGDPGARFVLVQRAPADSCIGCNLYDSSTLTPCGNAVVSAAGVIGTQVLAWAALLLLLRRPWPAAVRIVLLELVALTVLGDLVFQTAQGFAAGVPAREPLGVGVGYVDAAAFVSFSAQATGVPIPVVAALGVALLAADLAAMAGVALLGRRRRAGGSAP